jgi:hypothetical protein
MPGLFLLPTRVLDFYCADIQKKADADYRSASAGTPSRKAQEQLSNRREGRNRRNRRDGCGQCTRLLRRN